MYNDKFYLTQAVLDGYKTQTRRLLKDKVSFDNWEETLKHAPYQVGEIIAIAQPYKDIVDESAELNDIILDNSAKPEIEFQAGWNNKMFVRADLMPHQIRITNVHVERLQDISEEDCLKEGVKFVGTLKADGVNDYFFNVLPTPKHPNSNIVGLFNSPRVAYAELLDQVSGKGTWQSNPFVWVYDFELVK